MLAQITFAGLSGGGFLGGWEGQALIALLVSFGMIGLAFAVAIGFGYKELEDWAKTEMYEIFISGVIFGCLLLMINFIWGISINLAGGDPFALAHNALDMMILDTTGVFLNLFITNMMVGAMSTLMFSFFIPIVIIPTAPALTIRIGSFISPWAGLSSLLMGIDTVFNFVSAMLAVLLAEQVLLDFFKIVMLKYFLPLGILMRTFPLTRVAGGTIIAIAIGAYIIYPLAIVYSWDLYNQYKATVTPGTPGNPIVLTFQAVSYDMNGVVNGISAMMKNFVIISSLFLLSAIITLSSIRSLAGALGGDPDLFGLARLV